MREVKKSFWDFITISGSTLISIPLMIVSESIQARFLGPDNYGKVALFIGAISLFYLFGMSWLRTTIMRFGKEEFVKENHLRKTTGNFVIVNSFCFLVIVLIFTGTRSPILNFLEIKDINAFWIILAGLFLSSVREFIYEALKVIRLIKIQQILFRFASKIFIVAGIVFLAFILLDIRVEYVILVFLGSDLFIILSGFYFIRKSYLFPLSYDKHIIKKMVAYAIPLLFTSWTSYVVNWVDLYVIKYFMTLTDVGIYQAAYKTLSTLKSFWGQGLVTITTPIIMVYKTHQKEHAITHFYLKRLLPQISFVSMILIALVLVFSDQFFYYVYGSTFISSVTPFKILMSSVNFSAVSLALLAVITSFDMTKQMLYIGLTVGILNLLFDIILVHSFGILGASIASCLIFTTGPLLWYRAINKKFHFNRPLVFLFPVFTYLILFVNLSQSFIFRLSLSFLLIIVSYVIARHYDLFLVDDKKLLDNITMPEYLRKLLTQMIYRMAKK